jgi:hypothetical protein
MTADEITLPELPNMLPGPGPELLASLVLLKFMTAKEADAVWKHLIGKQAPSTPSGVATLIQKTLDTVRAAK